jgi:hypothetical protein
MPPRPRVVEVCNLKAGWQNGSGYAVDIEPEWVEKVVQALEAAGLGTPSIYPTPDGEVQLEWPDGREMVVR